MSEPFIHEMRLEMNARRSSIRANDLEQENTALRARIAELEAQIAEARRDSERERKRLDWILNTQDAYVGERHDNEIVYYRAFWRQYNSFNQTYFQHTEWVDSKTRAIDLAITQTERGN